MSVQSAVDVPLLINSSNASSERRISPSWTIAHLKTRLEPITGVPASSQQLSLRVASQDAVPITAVDEEHTQLAAFPLQPYAEITVSASSSLLSLPGNTDPVLEDEHPAILSPAATFSLVQSCPEHPCLLSVHVSSAGFNSFALHLYSSPHPASACVVGCPALPHQYPLISVITIATFVLEHV
jgi:hypothetical protein